MRARLTPAERPCGGSIRHPAASIMPTRLPHLKYCPIFKSIDTCTIDMFAKPSDAVPFICAVRVRKFRTRALRRAAVRAHRCMRRSAIGVPGWTLARPGTAGWSRGRVPAHRAGNAWAVRLLRQPGEVRSPNSPVATIRSPETSGAHSLTGRMPDAGAARMYQPHE
jgi:hypothetical protein